MCGKCADGVRKVCGSVRKMCGISAEIVRMVCGNSADGVRIWREAGKWLTLWRDDAAAHEGPQRQRNNFEVKPI